MKLTGDCYLLQNATVFMQSPNNVGHVGHNVDAITDAMACVATCHVYVSLSWKWQLTWTRLNTCMACMPQKRLTNLPADSWSGTTAHRSAVRLWRLFADACPCNACLFGLQCELIDWDATWWLLHAVSSDSVLPETCNDSRRAPWLLTCSVLPSCSS